MNLRDYRQQYEQGALARMSLNDDPFAQFKSMFDKAKDAGVKEPNAMTLATYDEVNGVNARIVLLKEVDHEGFVFFTNYHSRKGKDLAGFHGAALVFWWHNMELQIRIKGDVHKISSERSSDYFISRPHDSKAAAIASDQSEVVENYDTLITKYEGLRKEEDENLQRPDKWGGYCLVPTEFEFWQGRPNRMHDRFRYTKKENDWQIDQLFP